MAARFWVGGTGNWDAATTTHWAASSNGAGGQSVPGPSDDVTFDGSSGGGTVTVTATQSVLSITHSAHTGTLNFNGQTMTIGTFTSTGSATRTLTLGASAITITGTGAAWNLNNATNLTLNANTSTITMTGAGAVFQGDAKTYYGLVMSGGGTMFIHWGNTFTNLTITGTAVKTDNFTCSSTNVVTGSLTFTGNSGINRLLIKSNTIGGSNQYTTTGATVSATNTDFQDIALSIAKDFSGQTDIGDCGGNTGITFPAGVTQTWSGTSGGNWSANAWTTRAPLPQDNVVISSAFAGSPTIATDMPRLGKNLDFTGSTNTFTFNPTNCSLFGSLTLTSGMTLSGAGNFIFAGRSSFTITSAGKQFGCQILVQCPSGTYTLNDAFSTSQNFLLNNGTFDSNGFSATCLAFSSVSGTATRALTMGTSIWTLSSTAATTVWDQSTTTGLTFSGSSSTILINATSANTRIFAGGGLTHGALTYTVAGSTGQLSITGANSFSAINFSDASNARSLKFTAGTTTTIRNASGFNVRGTSGKLMTIDSLTAATHTLSSTGLQSCDYLSLTNSVATGGGAWYAGANSTNVSGNTGWIFTAAPAISATTGSAQHIQNLQNLQRF